MAVSDCTVEIVQMNDAGTAIEKVKSKNCSIQLGRDELDKSLAVCIAFPKVCAMLFQCSSRILVDCHHALICA